tara:strand:+ start:1282 stop:2244 length:963 start_codon:yes stop_codon:yes gene_type:complete
MDFREQFEKNKKKTRLVISTFVAIMVFVGLLADVSINSPVPQSLSLSLLSYLKFQSIPYITIGITIFVLASIWFISLKGHKLMLSGSKYQQLSYEKQDELDKEEKQLLNIVEEISISANLPYKPQVYIMETDEPNAFAAGWNEKNTIVGVTRGLLNKLNRTETQAVMAHEIGHIVHGDSKLTLYVGVLANSILTITNIFSHLFFFFGGGGNNSAAGKARLILLVLNLVLPIITQILYLYLSRSREYMADATAVELTGDNQAMISALEKISSHYPKDKKSKKGKDKPTGEYYRAASYIYEKGDSLFSTHPSIENRIKKLNN